MVKCLRDIFQDAFHDNFVIQWHPGSLRTMRVSISRPRVYLIDFEPQYSSQQNVPWLSASQWATLLQLQKSMLVLVMLRLGPEP